MKAFWSVLKRETVAYFSTPLAYLFLVIFLFFSSFLTFQKSFFELRQASLRLFFENMPLLFIFLVPAIAMRLWAEERRTNSIELLLTLPVTITQAVLGKFVAALGVILLALILTYPMVFVVCYLGEPDMGPIWAGYLGSLLLAATFLAIGSFFSTLTRSHVIAFVLAVVCCAVFLFAGSPAALDYLHTVLPGGLWEVVERLSVQTRFESMERGVIEIRDVAFFVFLTVGWLWANIVALNERRAAG